MMIIDKHLAQLIAEEAIAKPFRQLQVKSTKEMADWLKARDINLDWHFIHQLWRIGIIRPILVLEPAIEYALNDGTRFREADDYGGLLPYGRRIVRAAERLELDVSVKSYLDLGRAVAASDFTAIESVESRLPIRQAVIWHPLQLWLFHRLYRTTNFGALLGAGNVLAEGDSLVDIVMWLQQHSSGSLIRFAEEPHVREFDRVLALLIAAEPLVHPSIFPTISLRNGNPEDYLSWRSQQAGKELVEQLGLEDDSIKDWHRRLAVDASMSDPVKHFRVLLRHANRSDLERLQGAALLSLNLFDSAEILRRYTETYRGRSLPEEDEVIFGPESARVKQAIYGSSRTSDFDRQVFRRIARRFGLDPQARTTWFLEGATEIAFVKRIAAIEGISLSNAGVELHNLGGTGTISNPQFRALLDRLRNEAVFPYVTIDEERAGKHARDLREYAKQGRLPAGFRLWRRDFEEENFTLGELASVANRLLVEWQLELRISAEEIQTELDDSGCGPGEAIEKLTPIRKGEKWGVALADWASELDCPSSIADKSGSRPIFTAFSLVLSGQTSDYELTTEATVDEFGNLARETERPSGVTEP